MSDAIGGKFIPEPSGVPSKEEATKKLSPADSKTHDIFTSSQVISDVQLPIEKQRSITSSPESRTASTSSSPSQDLEEQFIEPAFDTAYYNYDVSNLSTLQRAIVYRDLGDEPDIHFPVLREIAHNHPDLKLRKEAQHVLGAEYQWELLEAQGEGDTAEMARILNQAEQDKIPVYKLVKDYHTTTDVTISARTREALLSNILKIKLGDAVKDKNIDEVKAIILEFSQIPNINYRTIEDIAEGYLKDPPFQTISKMVEHAISFCMLFEGDDKQNSVAQLVDKAERDGVNVSEVINLALMLVQNREVPENNLMLEARLVSLQKVEKEAEPLAVKLYDALLQNNQDDIRSIMNEVARSPFANDFYCFLQAEQSKRQSSLESHQIVGRVIAIYTEMANVPIRQHRMSPYELVKCAIVAEEQLHRTEAPKEVRLETAADTRPHAVDPTKRQITFFQRARGDTYLFGTYKKVTATLKVAHLAHGYQATASREVEARLRKDKIPSSGLAEWKKEIKALEEYKGLEGLLSYETVVNYTVTVGGTPQEMQSLLLKRYDKGNFWDVRDNPPPIETTIGYFTKIAAGLNNMHNFQELQLDGTRKVVPRIHGDIKPGNMLAASDGNAALCDYGFQYCPSKGQMMGNTVPYYGTPGYSAPEVTIADLNGTLEKENQTAFDCFAVGVSMLEVVGMVPRSMRLQSKYYNAGTIDPQKAEEIRKDHVWEFNNRRQSDLSQIKDPAKREYCRIAWEMMHPDPSQRMTADQYKDAMDELNSHGK